MKRILITGVAGFIGFYLAKRLLESEGDVEITGMDSMNDYYDVRLKEARLDILEQTAKSCSGSFSFHKGNLADKVFLDHLFDQCQPQVVVNLAAQAGVRYSITNPEAYVESNLVGFCNVLEACRHSCDGGREGVKHLVYASSSSVYGSNKSVPYRTADQVDNPVSLYAATKKSNELLAHAYSKLYGFPSTGLRFFTVYGPMGRPDMAYFGFTNKLVKGETIQIFNNGDMKRDFTYIEDIVTGIVSVMKRPAPPNGEGVPYKVYNIGNNAPEDLLRFVEILEICLLEEGIIQQPGKKEFLPMQPGDVYQTYADISDLERDFGFRPVTALEEGLRKFAGWYKEYYEYRLNGSNKGS